MWIWCVVQGGAWGPIWPLEGGAPPLIFTACSSIIFNQDMRVNDVWNTPHSMLNVKLQDKFIHGLLSLQGHLHTCIEGLFAHLSFFTFLMTSAVKLFNPRKVNTAQISLLRWVLLLQRRAQKSSLSPGDKNTVNDCYSWICTPMHTMFLISIPHEVGFLEASGSDIDAWYAPWVLYLTDSCGLVGSPSCIQLPPHCCRFFTSLLLQTFLESQVHLAIFPPKFHLSCRQRF